MNKVNTRATVQPADFTFPDEEAASPFIPSLSFAFFTYGESKREPRERIGGVKNQSPDIPVNFHKVNAVVTSCGNDESSRNNCTTFTHCHVIHCSEVSVIIYTRFDNLNLQRERG